jgi:NAD(P)-dependent dehydrogenase (short-subunit alcohol dehydrogenase family)
MTLAMAIELEPEGIKVNAVSPGFTKTNLNGYAGTETVEEGASVQSCCPLRFRALLSEYVDLLIAPKRSLGWQAAPQPRQ